MSFHRVGAGLRGMVVEWANDPSVRTRIVVDAWEASIGPALRERARPVELRDERLRVAVPDPAWESALREMEDRLVAELNEALGRHVVRAIEWCSETSVQPPKP